MKHLKQLVEYITGMDTRIGYPNEHLAGDSDDEVASPLYATAVGLLMNAIESVGPPPELLEVEEGIEPDELLVSQTAQEESAHAGLKERKSIFDKWSEKLKDFLDNAE